MRVKTPNNTNIEAYLKPNTIYSAVDKKNGFFEYTNHTLIGDDGNFTKVYACIKSCLHLNGQDWIIVDNRKELRDFIKTNKIKKTLVSKALGKAESWLTTMSSEAEGKRRGDISDKTFDAIMKMLHIDWESNVPVMVYTKGYVPYKTTPSSYKTEQHKQRLQQAFWNGDFVK